MDTLEHDDLLAVIRMEQEATAEFIEVLPIVDLSSHTVTFRVAGVWETHLCRDTDSLMRALLCAVRRPAWSPHEAELTVTTAQTRLSSGYKVSFYRQRNDNPTPTKAPKS